MVDVMRLDHGPAKIMEDVMVRQFAIAISQVAIVVVSTASSALAAEPQFATEAQARAMLEKAVVAVKENKEKALGMFNKGEGGFKDRDLYVYCANASDGVLTAHPYLKGEHLQEIKGKKGYPLGKEIMDNATEGEIKQVTYWWPRPGTDTPLEKTSFYTQVAGQNCGVGFYKE
jgi:signal transduction histidine kinase